MSRESLRTVWQADAPGLLENHVEEHVVAGDVAADHVTVSDHLFVLRFGFA